MGQTNGRTSAAESLDWKQQVKAFEKNTNGKMKLKDFQALQRQIAFEYPAVSSVHESMLICDNRLPDCVICYANSEFERMTLYPKERILGVNCRFLQGPLTDREVVKQVGEAVRNGRPLEVELLNYRADGVPFWNVFLMLPVHKSGKKSGKVEYFIAIQQDVSVIKGLGKDVAKWSAPEVCMWLEKNNLGYTVSRFLENRIEGHQLVTLSADDLREVGFKLRADRQRILDAIRADFDDELNYKHARSGEADGKRALQADVQACIELGDDDEVGFDYWGATDIGVGDRQRITVKCQTGSRMPVVFLMPRALTVKDLKKELESRVGRRYAIRFCDEEGDSYRLRTEDDLATALALADNHTVQLKLSKPSRGVSPETAAVLSCVANPVVCVDAFGLVVFANDAALSFLRADSVEETPVERWLEPTPEHKDSSLHALAGCHLSFTVHRSDDTCEACGVSVQLSSPGFAVVTLQPQSASSPDLVAN
eukprot:TRINITY_DN9004_c0_g1_i1.p1 TRINITY_DN9004_c0_g1~~TRINITY_DN9004_c0_g1_i1.p1  ORF type:complete len:481 (-),score=172.84 TRINITY_DN9004_c0_g1_i1:298-1740(-)